MGCSPHHNGSVLDLVFRVTARFNRRLEPSVAVGHELASASRRSSDKPPWRPASKSRCPRDASRDAPVSSKADGWVCLDSYICRRPFPVADFRQVLAVFIFVLLMLDQLVLELLFQALRCEPGIQTRSNENQNGRGQENDCIVETQAKGARAARQHAGAQRIHDVS